MCRSGASGSGMPGAGRTWNVTLARRANALMAVPPSQHNSADLVMTDPRAAVMLAASRRGRTASMVAPVRSRATMTGICSADRPRLLALPPRLRAALGRARRLPLKDSKINVSSASTIPDRLHGLVAVESLQEPVSPAERGCVVHAAAPGRFRDRLATDQGPRLILPAIRVV